MISKNKTYQKKQPNRSQRARSEVQSQGPGNQDFPGHWFPGSLVPEMSGRQGAVQNPRSQGPVNFWLPGIRSQSGGTSEAVRSHSGRSPVAVRKQAECISKSGNHLLGSWLLGFWTAPCLPVISGNQGASESLVPWSLTLDLTSGSCLVCLFVFF